MVISVFLAKHGCARLALIWSFPDSHFQNSDTCTCCGRLYLRFSQLRTTREPFTLQIWAVRTPSLRRSHFQLARSHFPCLSAQHARHLHTKEMAGRQSEPVPPPNRRGYRELPWPAARRCSCGLQSPAAGQAYRRRAQTCQCVRRGGLLTIIYHWGAR